MVALVSPAAIHPLTPGSPAYGALKIGAIGAIVGLRFVLVRRNKGQDAETEPEGVAPPVNRPHPVSKKKKRRKRRG
jgi:hypothetical protein